MVQRQKILAGFLITFLFLLLSIFVLVFLLHYGFIGIPHNLVAPVLKNRLTSRLAFPTLCWLLRHGPNDFDTGDGVVGHRSDIAWALGETADPRAIPPLIAALKNAVPYTRDPGAMVRHTPAARRSIALALGKFGPQAEAAIPALLKVLGEGRNLLSDSVDCENIIYDTDAAALALAQIGAKEAIPLLIEKLNWSPCYERKHDEKAIEALGLLGPMAAPAVAQLSQVLLSEQRTILSRRLAANTLGLIGDSRAVPALTKALSEEYAIAQESIIAFELMGPSGKMAVPAIVDLLSNPSLPRVDPITGVRYYSGRPGEIRTMKWLATKALAAIRTEEAIAALHALRNDPEICREVEEALAEISRTKK
jgi:HEAT repeat protein